MYTTFYTHAESMCFFVQSSAFQERTEAAVSSLHSAVESASSALSHVEATAGKMGSELGRMGSQLTELRAEEAGRFAETRGQLHGLSEMAGTSVDAMGAPALPPASICTRAQRPLTPRTPRDPRVAPRPAPRAARLHSLQEAFAAKQSLVLSQLGSLLDFHAALLGEFFDVKAILFYAVRARRAPSEPAHPNHA